MDADFFKSHYKLDFSPIVKVNCLAAWEEEKNGTEEAAVKTSVDMPVVTLWLHKTLDKLHASFGH